MNARTASLLAPIALVLSAASAAAQVGLPPQQCCCAPPRRPPVNDGPGDTVRRGGGTPSSPGQSGPAAGPVSSGGGRASGPENGPNRPRSPRGGSGSPASPTGDAIPDPDSWRYWWRYNRNPYLDLRRSLSVDTVTGSDDFFLGRGEVGEKRVAPLSERVHGEVAPSLANLLVDETNPSVVASALLALAKFGDEVSTTDDPGAVVLIQPFLADGHRTIAEMAVVALGLTRSSAALGTLGHLAHDDEEGRRMCGHEVPERMRAFAAYGIALIGEATDRTDVRRYAVQKLARAWEVAGDSRRDLRVAVLLGLGLMPLEPTGNEPADDAVPTRGLEDQIAWVLEEFDGDAAPLVRAHAPTAMARLLAHAEGASAVELRQRVAERLIRAIGPRSRETREIRMSAAQALGQIADADGDAHDERIRKALALSIDTDADRQVRAFALMSLAQSAARRGDAAGDVWAAVDDVRTDLLAELVDGKRFLQPWAALGLAVLERGLQEAQGPTSHETTATLRRALADERSPELCGALCIALGIARDHDASETILGTFGRTDPETRSYATIALGMIDARSSLEMLEQSLERSKYQPRLVWSTAVSMALMRNSDVVTQLVGLLEKSSSSITRSGVCFALGYVGDASAVTALLRSIQDKVAPDASRALAIEALGIVGDRGDLPWNTVLSVNTNYRAAPPTLSGFDAPGVLDLF